nr:hypothetical protein [uncultured Brevundimonas sp.]
MRVETPFKNQPSPSGFTYNGHPITPQQAADLIRDRHAEWSRTKSDIKRERDERASGILRQLWAMIRGRDV